MNLNFSNFEKLANKVGLSVTAGEIVGLVPLEAIVDAGQYYNGGVESSSEILIQKAVSGLKLDVLGEFIPNERIIELSANL